MYEKVKVRLNYSEKKMLPVIILHNDEEIINMQYINPQDVVEVEYNDDTEDLLAKGFLVLWEEN